jgi:peptidoglycan/LPS O-acetylase OafA/YrhL
MALMTSSPTSFLTKPLHSVGHSGFRTDIEGLRAVAILLVVAFHAGIPGVGGGFVGVDVFFVLSGYLITELLVREVDQTGTLNFGRFYARRVRRLLPASSLMLACTLAFGYAVLSPLEVVRLAKSAMFTACYASNIWFLVRFTDYFGPGVSSNPLLHTWSLAVEEQFYLVWPLVVLFCARERRSRKTLLITLSGIGAVSFGLSVWLTRAHQPIAFFSAPTRAWEFAVGGLATLVPMSRFSRFVHQGIVPWLGAAMIIGSGLWLKPAYGFPGFVALIPALGTVLILITGKPRFSSKGLFAFLEMPAMQKIGSLSYSWYLWHWPVFVFGRILMPHATARVTVPLALGSLGIAWLANSLIENPIRFSSLLALRPAASLAMGALLTIGGVAGGLLCHQLSQRWAASPSQEIYVRATSNQFDSCLTGFHHDQPRICSFGTNTSPTVVLFGDSHAEQWLPALRQVAETNRLRVVTLLKASCPSTMVPIYNPRLEREEPECNGWRNKALAYIANLKPSVVLISNSAEYVQRASVTDPYARLTAAQWERGTRATLEILNRIGSHVVLVRDTPRPDVDEPICLSRSSDHPELFPPSRCEVQEDHALAPSVWSLEKSVAGDYAHVSTLDMTDMFCASDRCPPMLNGIVVYRDTNHVSALFAASMAPALAERLAHIMASQNAISLGMHNTSP